MYKQINYALSHLLQLLHFSSKFNFNSWYIALRLEQIEIVQFVSDSCKLF